MAEDRTLPFGVNQPCFDLSFDEQTVAGSAEMFRAQMNANWLRNALIAPQVTPDANQVMADCSVLSDHPYDRLFVCSAP
jgi:hypothetical protein